MSAIKNTKLFVLISALIVVAGVIVAVLCNGFNLGFEFTGGKIITIDTAVEFNPNDITDALNKSGIKSLPMQIAFNDDTVKSVAIIKAKAQDVTDEKINAALNIIKSKYPKTEIKYNETYGRTASLRMFLTPAIAMIVAAVAVFVFALIFFKAKIALIIIICLIHDVILFIALTAITRHEVTLNYSIVLMAVAAFSVHQGFVLFANVKGNKKQKSGISIEKVLPETINHVIFPAASIVLVSLLLALITHTAIGSLALMLAVGVVICVYSNIVFASPLYIKFMGKGKKSKKR